MGRSSSNEQTLKLAIDTLTFEIKQLKHQVEQQEKAVQNEKLKDKESTPTKVESWIKNLVMVLGIPGIFAALFLQFSLTRNTDAQVEKTRAETEQIQVNTLKQKTDILIDTLLSQKTKNLEEYKSLINNELPKLKEAVKQFEEATVVRQNQNTLLKYVILWIVFIAIGFFFNLISTFWSSLLNLSMRIIYKKTQDSYNNKRQEKLRHISEVLLHLLIPLPSILDLVVRLSIFIVLIIPLFKETALLLGSNIEFHNILGNVREWEFSAALKSLKNILFPE
ncbi:hypothetical protein ACFS7Z_08540 [Pontibacter toksunensis]|uniref:Uncharacterized protein n=1 Tax=Pontibacter toksunensis TaxID=1332631 RepID=A0ABW6BTF4_9BACT